MISDTTKSPVRPDRVNVWVIEDEDFFRNALVESFTRNQRVCCEHAFSNYEDAIALLEQDHAPEILLADIVLPGMDGIEGTRRVKAISPSTHVMMLTNYADDDKIFRAICAGASGYLLKTSTADEINGGIEEAIAGGAPMNAQIARRVIDMFAAMATPKGSYGLTRREREILELMVQGFTKKQAGERLFLSFYTVQTHIKNIYAKLQVHTRTGAVAKALKEHLLLFL